MGNLKTGSKKIQIKALQLLSIASEKNGKRGVSGTETIALSLLKYWDFSKIKLCVCYSSKGRLYDKFKNYTDKLELIDFYISAQKRFPAFFKLIKIIKNNRIELIHTHGPCYTDFVATLAAKICGIPNIVTRHVMVKDLQVSKFQGIAFVLLDKFTKKFATTFTTICTTGKESLINEGCSINKIVNIYNGVDTDLFYAKERKFELNKEFTFIMVAQMTQIKRFDIFIRALSIGIKKQLYWKGIIVGDGFLLQSYVDLVKELQIENKVSFLGHQSELTSILHKADVMILVSEREGLPMCLIEGMACGLPIIVNEVGGTKELFEDGKNGFLLTRLDAQLLCETMLKATNINFLKTAHEISLARVKRRYTLKQMTSSYLDAYYKFSRKNV